MIEKRPLAGKGARWTKVATLDAANNSYCVENLKESEFLFRIFAENSIGLSPPATSEPVTLQTHACKSYLDIWIAYYKEFLKNINKFLLVITNYCMIKYLINISSCKFIYT